MFYNKNEKNIKAMLFKCNINNITEVHTTYRIFDVLKSFLVTPSNLPLADTS